MRCKKFQLKFSVIPKEEWSSAARDHLNCCPKCQAALEAQEQVRDLISLKVYEKPPPTEQEKASSRILQQAHLIQQKRTKKASNWRWVFTEPKYGFAILIVIFVALNMLSQNSSYQPSEIMPIPPENPAPELERESLLSESTTNEFKNYRQLMQTTPVSKPGAEVKMVNFRK